ncbi:MAG: YajD family HNH nuclease [Desulfomonile sp.]|nr:YajD family HNH nuclease [Desulfomonile sp.]
MPPKAPPKESSKLDKIIDEAIRDRERRQNTYREQALKLFPWVCARCGREFSGKKLKELTVHHKDHDHDNNPPDGSNWELLCIYCHDFEHQRLLDEESFSEGTPDRGRDPRSSYKPFANLPELLKKKNT